MTDDMTTRCGRCGAGIQPAQRRDFRALCEECFTEVGRNPNVVTGDPEPQPAGPKVGPVEVIETTEEETGSVEADVVIVDDPDDAA